MIVNEKKIKFNVMKYILLLISVGIILSCKKDKVENLIPFKITTIYKESFDDDQSWIRTPEDSSYGVGKECVRIEDQILKLTFDQQIPNCGCAWIGAKKSIKNLQNIPNDKLGVRLTLEKGFFQQMVRYSNSVDQFGNLTKSGDVISESSFRFTTPSIQMTIANPFNAGFPADSVVSEDFNRINGVVFEMIYNNGEKIFFIDGVKVDQNLVNISKATITNQVGIDFQFLLGHQPEFSPRLDELYIKELEVFTWQGEYPY